MLVTGVENTLDTLSKTLRGDTRSDELPRSLTSLIGGHRRVGGVYGVLPHGKRELGDDDSDQVGIGQFLS